MLVDAEEQEVLGMLLWRISVLLSHSKCLISMFTLVMKKRMAKGTIPDL
jgi:hypothetical protein